MGSEPLIILYYPMLLRQLQAYLFCNVRVKAWRGMCKRRCADCLVRELKMSKIALFRVLHMHSQEGKVGDKEMGWDA